MSYVSIIEQVYDELQAYILNKLPPILAAYEKAQPGLSLPIFNQVYRGDYQITDIKQYPAIIVKPGSVSCNPAGEQRALTKDLLIFNISYWLVSSINTSSNKIDALENMQKVSERYAWAVKTIVDSPNIRPTQASLMNSIMRVTGFDWSPVEIGSNVKVSAAYVDIELKAYNNRS